MPSQDYNTIWNRLLLRCPAAGAALAQDYVRDAFQQLAQRRQWSWLQKSSSFYPHIFSNTGFVSVTLGSNVVTGTGTNFTTDMVGCQFRIGSPPSSYPTYTIIQWNSATSVVLDKAWNGPNLSLAQFQIFQCYFPVPDDFNYFYSIINVTSNYRVWHNLTQAELDLSDPQRIQTGIVYGAAFYDYTQTFNGIVGASLQVRGAGPSPVSTTDQGYSFPTNSVFSIEITVGGPAGTAQFQWKQDDGPYTTGVVSSTAAIDLAYGVQVYFPPLVTYVVGDVFIIQAFADTVSGVPRYELWPRPINTPYVYPYLYISKWPELTPEQPQLPLIISQRGDVLLEMALANCARYPGTDTTRNPYFNLALAVQHEERSNRMIFELEVNDDDLAIKDLRYQQLPFAPAPWMDGNYLQSHAWPFLTPG